jgi:hypothetical protein
MDTEGVCAPIRSRFPRGLLKLIDDEAKREERSRAKMMLILVREALTARLQARAA